MSTPRIVWIGLALFYAMFFSWYTSFGGPLDSEEIEVYIAILEKRAPPERVAVWRRFLETDTGDDFAMINMLDLREVPAAVEGIEPGETSYEVMARYTTPFMKQAMKDAAHPVLLGEAANSAMDVWGIEGATSWTGGGLVRYRSRRDLMEQVVHMSDEHIHRFKIAALEKTIAFPLDPWFQLGDPRFVLALIFTIVGLCVQLVATKRVLHYG